MILECVVVGQLEVNCYVLAAGAGRQALIIDPGDDEEKIFAVLERNKLTPGLVVNTHGHCDHIGCDDSFGVQVCIHALDAPMLASPKLNLSVVLGEFCKVRARIRELGDAQEIELDGCRLQVMHTPGHTPGGICLLMKGPETGRLFSGDTLFSGSVGRSDLQGGDGRALQRSLRSLAALPDATAVFPGHGPSTTIGKEKQENPFLR
jgi:hydroxyacylglutathione hydrolase